MQGSLLHLFTEDAVVKDVIMSALCWDIKFITTISGSVCVWS